MGEESSPEDVTTSFSHHHCQIGACSEER